MSVTLIIGPMYSSKTTTILSYEKKFKISKKKYVLINHSFDKRYCNKGKIVSHDKVSCESEVISCENLSDIEEGILEENDCFIIDEIQFFNDSLEFCDKWSRKNKIIICAGLSGTYEMKEFKSVSKLIPFVDNIIHLKSICSVCGNDAAFSKRLSDEKDEIVIGTDIYQPRCRRCFHN